MFCSGFGLGWRPPPSTAEFTCCAPCRETDHGAARELRQGLHPLPAAVIYYALHHLYACAIGPRSRMQRRGAFICSGPCRRRVQCPKSYAHNCRRTGRAGPECYPVAPHGPRAACALVMIIACTAKMASLSRTPGLLPICCR